MAKFKTRARAIDMLGRQQIANISTAISELFKNSYDAYADNIEADYFRYNDLFVLRDDGTGMSESQFTERWLAVGTESKYIEDGSGENPPPGGKELRFMMGEKGIGRLAISTIGSQVLVLSRSKENDIYLPTVAAFLNWRIFEAPGIDLDEIEIPVIPYPEGTLPTGEEVSVLVELFRENIEKLKSRIPKGLRKLILEDLEKFDFDPNEADEYLRSFGNERDDPKSNLSLLGNNTGTHFYILPAATQLGSEIDEDKDGDGAPPLIKTLVGFTNTMKLPAEPDAKRKSWENEKKSTFPKPLIRTAFRDHTSTDFYKDIINSQNFFTLDDFELTDHLVEGKIDEDGNFEGKIRIYNQDPIDHFVEKPKGIKGKIRCGSFNLKFGYVQGAQKDSSLSSDDFNRITSKMDRIGGLYIYKDNIRVQPYGNYDNDYLGLEMRRTKKASYYFFSYRRLFGYVEVSKKNNRELAEKAGREGFIDNEAYKQFKKLLVNLFVQLAVDFFRESGKNLGGYIETKTQLSEAAKIRKEIEKNNNETRKKLRNDLGRVIEVFDNEIPGLGITEIVEEFYEKIEMLRKDLLPEEFTDQILTLEKSYQGKIKKLHDKYKLKKPQVGLDEKLTKEWEHYRNEFLNFENNNVGDAYKRISEISQQSLNTKDTSSPIRKWVLENSKLQVTKINKEIKSAFIETKNSILKLSQEVEKIQTDFNNNSKTAENDLRNKLVRGNEEVFHDAFGIFSEQLDILSDNTSSVLAVLSERISDLYDTIKTGERPYTLDETIAAIEEENINLRTRYDESIELAQLGMAVSIIGHEFSGTANHIRESIQRLGVWAKQSPELADLYENLKSGFEHFDSYLTTFAPLQRRLYRTEIDIEGGKIAAYLRRIFSVNLTEHEIDLEVSDRFSTATVTGYPSTFYPVFINLVDNAIYWLRDRPTPRKIKLDVAEDGSMTVSDTGPGIHPTDRDFIFEPGFSRKPGGRGLGLKISREVLDKAGYELLIGETSPKSGTTFIIKQKD